MKMDLPAATWSDTHTYTHTFTHAYTRTARPTGGCTYMCVHVCVYMRARVRVCVRVRVHVRVHVHVHVRVCVRVCVLAPVRLCARVCLRVCVLAPVCFWAVYCCCVSRCVCTFLHIHRETMDLEGGVYLYHKMTPPPNLGHSWVVLEGWSQILPSIKLFRHGFEQSCSAMATQKLEEKVQQHDEVAESSKSGCRSQSRAHGERWGAGVEYHFQEI